MMLAMRGEADVAEQDDLVVALDLAEGALQDGDRIERVAGEILLEGASDARRCLEQTLAGRIIVRPAQEGGDGRFCLGARRAAVETLPGVCSSRIAILLDCMERAPMDRRDPLAKHAEVYI
jgi:hypothetical protein